MKIAVTSPSFSKHSLLKTEICKFFEYVKLNESGERLSSYKLIEFIGDADGVIVGLENLDQDILQKLPKLKIVSKYGVGLNNIDIEACKSLGVTVGWTGGVNALSVAEMTLAYMLMLSRNIYSTSLHLKRGTWNKSGGFQLSGKTVGIIGVGHIGKEVIRLLKPFGCNILVNDIIDQKKYYAENGLREASKKKIYSDADIISIHTPLDDSTVNMIKKEIFGEMKRSSYVINSARGGIINEADLKEALHNKTIAGAAIDAYAIEPPEDLELLSFDNLVCTPHIGGNADEAVVAMGRSAIHHLREYFKL